MAVDAFVLHVGAIDVVLGRVQHDALGKIEYNGARSADAMDGVRDVLGCSELTG